MSKKLVVISIILLSLGGILIPSGLVINSSINNMVTNSVDEGLLGIQEEALPMVESMIAELGYGILAVAFFVPCRPPPGDDTSVWLLHLAAFAGPLLTGLAATGRYARRRKP